MPLAPAAAVSAALPPAPARPAPFPPPRLEAAHPGPAPARIPSGPTRALGTAPPPLAPAAPPGAVTVERLQEAQRRMDEVLALAQSGRSFSPAQLLALQAQVYRASQQLDLAGKVVEKATGGVKQVLQTQV